MPIYEYLCENCGHRLEELQSMSEPPLSKCPKCEIDSLKRLIGAGSGIIFKGSGFYLTDYKKKSSAHVDSASEKPKDKPSDTSTKDSKNTNTKKD